MHTRTGDSSSIGSGSSVGAVVTVGLGTSPWLSDQIEPPVACSFEQYAVTPSAVVAVLPTGKQLAPITATGGCTGSGGGGNGVGGGDATVGDVTVVGCAVGVGDSGRSARRNSMSATATAAISSNAKTAGTVTPARN